MLQERETMGQTVDVSGLEDGFVGGAKAYGDRRGISYAAWREIAVPRPC